MEEDNGFAMGPNLGFRSKSTNVVWPQVFYSSQDVWHLNTKKNQMHMDENITRTREAEKLRI